MKIGQPILLLTCLTLLASCDQNTASDDVEAMVEAETLEIVAPSIYIPFPEGYGYMENQENLQKATDDNNKAYIREHAWRLWAGIMQNGENDWPLWYTWPNTSLAFKSAVKLPRKPADCPATLSSANSGGTIKHKNKRHIINIDTPAPVYDVPESVKTRYPGAIRYNCQHKAYYVVDGKNFQSNGDIMIATESLSLDLFADITTKFRTQNQLNQLHKNAVHQIETSERSIVTKHMYWPVKAKGVTAIPVWKNDFPPNFTGYAGYETWLTLVALDPSGAHVGKQVSAEFLYHVKEHDGVTPMPTVKGKAQVYPMDRFYFHKVTEQDWANFNEADKAILDAASVWANNQSFEVGDYLVSVAMHVNTRELPSWTLQSVWWTDTPNDGPYASDRPKNIPQAKGPWQHYLLTDSYAVPPNKKGEYDIAVNPYIEGVIHPIATSCRNCHVRAGWPEGSSAGSASYQNPDCPGLLSYLTPSSACLAPITLTDYLWIIPDRAVKDKK